MELQGYEDFELVGAGGNAHVYKATQSATGDVVAVKILRGAGDESVNRRFDRERSMMAELETIANVVPIYESGFTESSDPYLVMPLFRGGSLQQLLEAGPLDWREAVEMTRKVASSVSLAHAKRILHLDVKPANVLLDANGEPWLADFGISEMMGNTASMSAQMLTPAFTPPERLNGEKPSEHTDVYGLAATLFALLAGKAPFMTPERTSPMAVMMAVVNEPVPLDEIELDVPDDVRNLLSRSMAKDLADRPASAIEFVGLLDDVLAGVEITPLIATGAAAAPAVEAGATVSAQPLGAALSGELTPLTTSEPAQRSPVLIGLLSLLLLLSAGAAAFFAFSGGGADGTDGSEVAAEGENSADGDGVLESEPATQVLGASVGDDTQPDSDDDDEAAVGSADAIEPDEDGSQGNEAEATGTEVADNGDVTEVVDPTEPDGTTTAAPTTTRATTTTRAPTTTTTQKATTTTRKPTTTTSTSTTTSSTATTEKKVVLEAAWRASGGPTGSEQTVSFANNTIGDATSFSWKFGDGGTSSAKSPSHTYASPGTYSVTLTATGPSGSDSATHSVRVDANTVAAPPLEAGFRASAGPTGSEQTVSFANITIGDATSFSWDFGDGGTSSAKSPSHTYASPGTYSVTITATGPSGSDSATHSVRVDPNS